MVAHACHPNKILFLAFFEKTNKKNVSKSKTILLSFRKYFLNKNIFVSKNFISFRKHFHFCVQIKIFSFQKQK